MSTHSPNPPSTNNSSNFDKEHYNHLIGSIKWIMSIAGAAITIMAAFATFTTYSSVNEYKKDLKENMLDIKKDISDIKGESISTMKGTRDQVNTEISTLKSQIKDEVVELSQNAENQARSAVQKRLDEEFESRNIRALIAQTADEQLKGQVGLSLEQKVRERTQEIDEQTRALATLSVAIDQIRDGSRKWFFVVDSMQKTHRLSIVRELAMKLLQQKISDYKMTISYDGPFSDSDRAIKTSILSGLDVDQTVSVETAIPKLIHSINTNQELKLVVKDFLALKRIANENFELFDISQVNNWYKNQYPLKKEIVINRFKAKRFVIIMSNGPAYLIAE